MIAAVLVACIMCTAAPAEARYRDGMNLYQYVRSGPASRTDPFGLESPATAPVPAKAAWVKDANTMLDDLYGGVYKERQKDLATPIIVQQWTTDARNVIEKGLCGPECIGTDPAVKKRCTDEAAAIAEAYVSMFVKKAYSMESFGADNFRDVYRRNVKLAPAALAARLSGAFPNADPWDFNVVHGGWLGYQWAWMTAGAVDTALRSELAKRQKAEEAAKKAGNADRPTTVIKYSHAGEQGENLSRTQEIIKHNWVVLKTKAQNFCAKDEKGTKTCQVWMDPWIYPPGRKTVEPRVYLPKDHPNEWNFIAKKPKMTGVRDFGGTPYDEFIPEGQVHHIVGPDSDFPGRLLGIERKRVVPKGWDWPDPATLP